MDEYLFLTVAKLKADRMRLEREERRRMPLSPPEQPRREASPQRAPSHVHPLFSLVSWR